MQDLRFHAAISTAQIKKAESEKYLKWHDEHLTRFEKLPIVDRIEEYEYSLRFLIDAMIERGWTRNRFHSDLIDQFQKNRIYYVDEGDGNWFAINPDIDKPHIPKFNSDKTWAHTPITNFRQYFDIPAFEKKYYPRAIRVKDKLVSDTIIEYAKRLYEYNHLVNYCSDIVGAYDVVNTKFGPTILTTDDNIDEIRYVRKALLLLLNPYDRKNHHYVDTILKYLEYFEDIDNEKFYEDGFSWCFSCHRPKERS
jgi:hypothetical protein